MFPPPPQAQRARARRDNLHSGSDARARSVPREALPPGMVELRGDQIRMADRPPGPRP